MSLTCGKTIVIILSILIILLAGLTYLFNRLSNNLAGNVARPIEKSLVEAGAVKMCSSDDPGHGPDNFSPWYNAIFVVDGSIDHTKELIASAAKKNGYNISEFKENDNKSYLYASGSKPGKYENLKSGDARITFDINLKAHYDPNVDNKFCTLSSGDGLVDNKTSFGLMVRLPEYKTPSFFQL